MFFDDLLGNNQVKEFLTKALSNQTLGNSILFSGIPGIGKGLFAHACAKALLGLSDVETHPDIHIYKPEGKIGLHSIDSMRDFSEQVYLAPFKANKKVFIIHDADRMLAYSANALLKTFEEPAYDTTIILVSSAIEALLPTILSRCRVVRFHPLAVEEISRYLIEKEKMETEKANHVAKLAEGSLGRAIHLVNSSDFSLRQQLFDSWSSGKFRHYKDLLNLVKNLNQVFEEVKESDKDNAKSGIDKEIWTNLTAQQKDLIEKEAEGMSAIHTYHSFKNLCVLILSWYRDLHLLNSCSDSSSDYLINPDFKEALKEALNRKEILPLEYVEKAIQDTLLSFQRSTPLSHCLESLFLQLKRI